MVLMNAAWVLYAPSFTTAGSARSSAEVHNLGPRLSRPRGSVLSPLLFLVFINDLRKGVSQPNTVDIFADDTTISLSSPYTDTSGLCSKLCESTCELENWSRNKRCKLNTKKTKSMFVTRTRLRIKIGGTSVNEMRIFTSKGEELDNTTSHKLLGVYVDQDLSFNEHVEQLCKKLTKRIGLLRSIRQYLSLNERILLYNTTIKPVFLYGGTVWSSTSKCNIRRIFRLQKRAARVILGLKTRDEPYLRDWTGYPFMMRSM